jgi:AraC family transcriptional regulator of adaptative response/methylated-DNA-[protein]-cysteine methyltransferase
MTTNANGEVIRYATQTTVYGPMFGAVSPRGLCLLHLLDRKVPSAPLAELRRRFPDAALVEDAAALAEVFRTVDALPETDFTSDIALDLGGTTFQQKVWRVMRKIPAGTTVTYGELARRAGNPKAFRAAASACARNPVVLFVPCHRVVASNGLGGFGCGLERKRQLLEMEGALTST